MLVLGILIGGRWRKAKRLKRFSYRSQGFIPLFGAEKGERESVLG
jgi:hypothetical protein